MKIKIEKIYYDENHGVCMSVKLIEPNPPPYNEVCAVSDNDMKRYMDADEKYKRQMKNYSEEITHFFLGEAEITQK